MKYVNRFDKHKYLFLGKVYSSKTQEVLYVKPTVKSSKTYLYYTDNKGSYINEQLLVEQIGKYVNRNIELGIMNQIKSKIGTLKRKDRLINEIENLYESGLISHSYY